MLIYTFVTSYKHKFNAFNFISSFPVLFLSKTLGTSKPKLSQMLAQFQCCWSETV